MTAPVTWEMHGGEDGYLRYAVTDNKFIGLYRNGVIAIEIGSERVYLDEEEQAALLAVMTGETKK